jgi:hypothetical protein
MAWETRRPVRRPSQVLLTATDQGLERRRSLGTPQSVRAGDGAATRVCVSASKQGSRATARHVRGG